MVPFESRGLRRNPTVLRRPAAWQGRTVDFKNTLIIMTSNVGSSVIEKGGGGLGFQLDNSEEDSSYNRIKVRTTLSSYMCSHPKRVGSCSRLICTASEKVRRLCISASQ